MSITNATTVFTPVESAINIRANDSCIERIGNFTRFESIAAKLGLRKSRTENRLITAYANRIEDSPISNYCKKGMEKVKGVVRWVEDFVQKNEDCIAAFTVFSAVAIALYCVGLNSRSTGGAVGPTSSKSNFDFGAAFQSAKSFFSGLVSKILLSVSTTSVSTTRSSQLLTPAPVGNATALYFDSSPVVYSGTRRGLPQLTHIGDLTHSLKTVFSEFKDCAFLRDPFSSLNDQCPSLQQGAVKAIKGKGALKSLFGSSSGVVSMRLLGTILLSYGIAKKSPCCRKGAEMATSLETVSLVTSLERAKLRNMRSEIGKLKQPAEKILADTKMKTLKLKIPLNAAKKSLEKKAERLEKKAKRLRREAKSLGYRVEFSVSSWKISVLNDDDDDGEVERIGEILKGEMKQLGKRANALISDAEIWKEKARLPKEGLKEVREGVMRNAALIEQLAQEIADKSREWLGLANDIAEEYRRAQASEAERVGDEEDNCHPLTLYEVISNWFGSARRRGGSYELNRVNTQIIPLDSSPHFGRQYNS